jgi:hypothetical protein
LNTLFVGASGAAVGLSERVIEVSVNFGAGLGSSISSNSSSAQEGRFFAAFTGEFFKSGNSSFTGFLAGGAETTAAQAGLEALVHAAGFDFGGSFGIGFNFLSSSESMSRMVSSFGLPHPPPPAGTRRMPGSCPSFSDLRLPN